MCAWPLSTSNTSLAGILETAIDIAIDKKDPKKKLERQRKRQKVGGT